MKNLEKSTYGKSKCAYDLVSILNKELNRCNRRLVSRILTDYFHGFNDILKTEHITETLIIMWLMRFKERVDGAKLDIDIKTRLKNLMVGKYRKELKILKNENNNK